MKIIRLLLITALFALLGSVSSMALAAEKGAVKLTSIAQVEIESTGADGKKTVTRVPAVKVVPGKEVIYTTTFENLIKKPVGKIVINNPIPNDSEYTAGSAFGKDCDIEFSADGGKTFGHADTLKVNGADGKTRPALPKDYTNVRWIYKKQLAAGKSGEVGFRAVVK